MSPNPKRKRRDSAAARRREQETAFNLGRDAYGKPNPSNPFRSDGQEINHHAWNDGFEFARRGGELGKTILDRLRQWAQANGAREYPLIDIHAAISFDGRPSFTDMTRVLRMLAAVGAVKIEHSGDGRLNDTVILTEQD